jgi:hypothetical protein
MLIQNKLDNKIIKMKFDNTIYVLTTNMTFMSSIKLIKQKYDRDMYTKILVHVAIDKKICDIKKYFEMMILEYVKYETSISRNAIVTKSVSNDQKNEMLIDQASKKKEKVKNSSRSITNSEQITHEKSDRKHIMKFNQSNEKQRKKFALNNSHSFRQDSESEDDSFKTQKSKNDDLRKHFIKVSNIRNDDFKKQAKTADIIHHKFESDVIFVNEFLRAERK